MAFYCAEWVPYGPMHPESTPRASRDACIVLLPPSFAKPLIRTDCPLPWKERAPAEGGWVRGDNVSSRRGVLGDSLPLTRSPLRVARPLPPGERASRARGGSPRRHWANLHWPTRTACVIYSRVRRAPVLARARFPSHHRVAITRAERRACLRGKRPAYGTGAD